MKTKFFLLSILLLITIIATSCRDDEKQKVVENDSAFGIDVSHYNGEIHWEKVKKQKKHKPIKFVIVRSSMGGNRVDKKFKENFAEAKKHGFIVGAYHYYDPNENSHLQARNFIKQVSLQKGDIYPVLDIEKISKIQSMDKLRQGLKNWLIIIEKHYGVKPVIYTGLSFYEDYLKNYGFAEYPLWVAAYSVDKRSHDTVERAVIHQFSDKVKVPGINEYADANDAKSLDRIRI